MANLHSPIGVFDSGVGGLSIWNEIHRLLPNESSVYLADSKNAPYGEKSLQEIIRLSVKNTEILLEKNTKLIVVACNTATTNAISHLRKTYSVPFVGIEPATKPAAIATKTGKIGILATKGTLASQLFLNTSSQFRSDIEIIETIGTGLVHIIENGDPSAAEPLLKKYLQPMIDADVDNIVLGCSHYPFLIETMRKILPAHVQIIDSGEPVARRTKKVLEELQLLNDQVSTTNNRFYTNADLNILNGFLNRLGVDSFESSYLNF